MPNNEDVAWRFGTRLDKGGRRVQCRFCDKKISGGITRLKEHLANKAGNVSGCPKVSPDVRREMWDLLVNLKVAKKDKEKRIREFEEDIVGSYRGNENEDNEDDDDDDEQLAYARHQSRMQHEFDHRRQFEQNVAGAGGSRVNSQLHRTGSVRETRSRGNTFEPISTPTSRLRARVVELEKDHPKQKQTKIGSSWLKTAKKQLLKAWGNFMIDTNIPFRAIESPYANPLMQTIRDVGEGVRAPTAYDIAEIYLPEAYNEMKEYIKTLEPIWDERGVTIMCDGWTGPTNMHIINFLIYSVRGTIFHKSIDASHVLCKNANYYYKLMNDVVKEIGPHRVIQIVTDNEAAVKAGGKKLMEQYPHIYWTPCVAHCLDLLLEDLGKRKNIKSVIEQAQKVTRFIYHYKWAANYMKTFTGGRELLRPSLTRFATNFIMLESVVDQKIALQNMFNSPGWINTRYYDIDETAVEVRELFSRSPSPEVARFWDKANEILKIQAPIVRVLRLVDGDPLPTMGYIYEAMERCKLAIKENCSSYKQYWAMIDKRWDGQLHQDLHAAGCYFNPKFLYGVDKLSTDKEIKKGVKNVIEKLAPDMDTQIKASTQLFIYEQKMDSFASTVAQRAIQLMDPATWWSTYGDSAPALQAIAVKVLSQTTSSSNCERNWSMWSLVHTKTRNRLKYKKLHQIVYLRYNMWLQRKHQMRRSQKDIDASFDPISLDNIFDCSDPINTWLEEEPFTQSEGTSWIYVSDDENDVGFRETGEEGNRVVGPEFAYQNKGSRTRESVLTPPSGDDDGDGDDDDGGYGENRNSYSDQVSPPRNFDGPPPGFQHVPEERFHDLDQVYERSRKGKYAANDMDINEYSWQGLSGNAVANESVGSNIDPHYPYYPNCEPGQPAGYQPSSGYDSTSNSQGVNIYNHGNINYGDTHYHNPSFYHGSDTSSTRSGWEGYSNQNPSAWGYNVGSFFNGNQNEQYGCEEPQEAPRHSFWY